MVTRDRGAVLFSVATPAPRIPASPYRGGVRNAHRGTHVAGGEFRPWRELARMPFGGSRYTLPGILLALFEKVPALMTSRAARILSLGRELSAELTGLLGDDAVLLYPSFPRLAPRHNTPLLAPFQFAYTGIFNVMQMPATQVPIGLDRRGLPLGVQIAGPRHADHLTIAVALALEKDLGGWTPPRDRAWRAGAGA